MNREQARALIEQTFTQPFDKSRFRNFAVNLLNHIDETKAFARNSQYIKQAFKDHVNSFERLGTYTSPDNETLDILIVHLTKESKLERARTAIRNFVADHLKERKNKDAALVAFVSPSEKQWRFSYVRMDYAAVEKESGNVGVETRLTPARRFSYIVGEGESCHTAQTRFLGLLQHTEADPALADIQEAFSVEAITREFYKKYAELFEEMHKALDRLAGKDKSIREEFTAKRVNSVDFAKKLMGQIVFLYFLQKKGWLGVARGEDWGAGPRDFLRKLARGEYGQYDNFFNDILEPLFYDTLATDRGHEAWCKRFKCRIPFLNGGLFEPLGNYGWRKTDILLPNKLFTNGESIEEGITGSGVLDVFDRYNFAVNEAEPLEKEVAIDPEMLGKVFENLIEENRRKGLGAYYTPREIVHYMCQESLINYLDTALNKDRETVPRTEIEIFVHLGEQISHYETVPTDYAVKMPKSIGKHARLIDEKLAGITVCDPAVGSGAFPVGMMTEIVRARGALTPYFNDYHERTPYHFKRHAIQNCLYGVDIDGGAVEIAKLRLWLSLVVDEEETKQIKPLPNLDYKIVAGNSLIGFPFKSQRLHEIEKLKARFFEETDHHRKADIKRQIERQLSECFASSKKSLGYEVDFDFGIYFSEVFAGKQGFDVVIANPPYVRQETLSGLKPVLRNAFPEVYAGTADLYCYFYARGIQILRLGGSFAFISSNKWFRANYGANLRKHVAEACEIRSITDFGELPVFESVATFPMIFIARKGKPPNTSVLFTQVKSLEFPYPNMNEVVRQYGQSLPSDAISGAKWTLTDSASAGLLCKIEGRGRPLGQYVDGKICRGLITGFNEAFLIDAERREELIAQDSKSSEIIKRLAVGDDVRKWRIESKDRWLILTPIDVDIKRFPAVFEHLKQWRQQLNKRWDKGNHWWELRACDYYDAFVKPKIVFPDIAKESRFAFDTKKLFVTNTTYFIPTGDLYLLGVLNSSAVWNYCKERLAVLGDAHKGGRLRFFTQFVEQIPVPDASAVEQTAIVSLVQKILAAKRRNPDADTAEWEREIDEVVYDLYGLTKEERALVEGSHRA